MKILYLFTTKFPFGKQETFLETEINFLSKKFDQIHIYPFNKPCKNDFARVIPKNVLIKKAFLSKNYYLRVLKSFILIKKPILKLFWKDFCQNQVFKSKDKTFKWFAALINLTNAYSSKSFREIKDLEEGILYFYWGGGASNLLHFLPSKSKVKCVVRLHGGDVYLQRSNGYLPLRENFYRKADFLIPVSEDIKEYLMEVYNVPENKINVSKLGTNYSGKNILAQNSEINIVTCSNLIPLKRLHLLLIAMSKIEDLDINHHHFGDGPEQKKLQLMAKSLPGNIKVNWHGRVRNVEILDFYRNNSVDLFINLSQHEGIPVSIMEAMSFGIPCLATDVGATRELVNNENGSLIKSDSKIEKEIIWTIRGSKKIKWKMKREEAYKYWLMNFNAEANYERTGSFLTKVIS